MLKELWQLEKDRLAEILYQRVTNGNENISREEVLDKGYPQFFEAFAKRKARKLFHDENPVKIDDDSRYDLDDPTVKAQLDGLEDYLTLKSSFTKNEIQQLAEAAINFQFDVLVRPRQTLLEKLYDDAEQHRLEDVLTILSGFGEDRPFIQKLILEIEPLEPDVLPQTEFVHLSKKTEEEIYRSAPISTFMKEIQLLLNFEGAVTGETHFVLKSPILLGLLRERSLDAIADSLKEEARDKEFWTPDEIENALDRFILVGGNPPETSGEESFESEQEVLNFKAEAPENNAGPDVLHIQFDEDGDDNSEPVTVVEHQPSEYPALHTLIEPKARKAIIKKIFHRDDFEYVEFIQRLERLDKWSDAKIAIDEELAQRKIAPQSKEAVLLGDVVFSRYFSKKCD